MLHFTLSAVFWCIKLVLISLRSELPVLFAFVACAFGARPPFSSAARPLLGMPLARPACPLACTGSRPDCPSRTRLLAAGRLSSPACRLTSRVSSPALPSLVFRAPHLLSHSLLPLSWTPGHLCCCLRLTPCGTQTTHSCSLPGWGA